MIYGRPNWLFASFSNTLKGRGVKWLLVLISDIRALWRSGLSARVPECQKLKCTLDLDGITLLNITV